MGMQDESRGVSTPGVKGITDYNAEDLDSHRSTKYRAMAARANFSGQDRSDIHFSVAELCRAMSCPKEDGWNKLKRFARYMIDKDTCIVSFRY